MPYRTLLAALLLPTCLLVFTACGGSDASEDEPAAETAGAEEEVGDPTEGGRRRAERGDRCDYGGAADMTCHVGLQCCYGPPENPGDFGECMPECPE